MCLSHFFFYSYPTQKKKIVYQIKNKIKKKKVGGKGDQPRSEKARALVGER